MALPLLRNGFSASGLRRNWEMAVGDLVPRPAEPRVLGIARLGQRRRRGLAHDPPSPGVRLGVGLHHLLKLEEERGVFVPGKQPEEHAVGELEGPAASRPLELEQPAVLGDGADVLDPERRRGGEAEEVTAPDPGVLLLLHDRERRLGFGDRGVGRRDCLWRCESRRRELGERAIADGRAGVLEEPGQRNPVLCRQVQNRS